MKDTVKRSRLGATLRALREQRNWTLAEVSRRTGFAVPMLSKVENDRLSLSYDKLIRLSEGMEVDIAELFATSAASITGRRSVNRVGEGEVVPTRNYEYRYLSPDVTRKKFVPLIAELHARTIEEFGELVRHSGEEFVYVLEGKVEIHTELYAPLVLSVGESAYLDSAMGHAYLSVGDGRCRLLAVCSASEGALRAATVEVERPSEAEKAPRAATKPSKRPPRSRRARSR
jgi:transcriptional regulator with XRE-family HTH domain